MLLRTPRSPSLFACLAGLALAGCGQPKATPSSPPVVASTTSSAAPSGSASADVAPSASDAESTSSSTAAPKPQSISVTAQESAAKGLPPVAITLEVPAGTGMSVTKFPGESVYVNLSGPPGGPDGISLEKSDVATLDAAGWKALAAKRYAGQPPLDPGKLDKVTLAGAPRSAWTCATGASMARTTHLLVLIAAPSGKGGVLLDLRTSAGSGPPKTPGEVAALPRYAPILSSLAVEFAASK